LPSAALIARKSYIGGGAYFLRQYISKYKTEQNIITTASAIKKIDSLLAKSRFVTTIVDDRQTRAENVTHAVQ
jgi:hypothetical protein